MGAETTTKTQTEAEAEAATEAEAGTQTTAEAGAETWDQILARRDGVITAAQALSCGKSRRQIRYQVQRGSWEPYARGVFFSRQHEFTERALVRAVAAAHRGGVLDRTAAAWWCGFTEELHRPLTLCIPPRSHRPPDLAEKVSLIHRSIPAEDLTEHRELAVTGPALTVLGALGTLESLGESAASFLDRVLQQKQVTLADLTAALDRNKGMHGLRTAKRLVATLQAGAESEAERLFAELLALHEITGWVQQFRYGGRPIDFAWPEERVSVEINGWAYHRDTQRFEADNAKAAMLAAGGWLPLSFTWKQLTDEPEVCIARVAAALALRRA